MAFKLSERIIDDFDGLAELARLVEAPISTVNSWRKFIPASRLNHLRLAAMAAGKVIAWDTLEPADRAKVKAA